MPRAVEGVGELVLHIELVRAGEILDRPARQVAGLEVGVHQIIVFHQLHRTVHGHAARHPVDREAPLAAAVSGGELFPVGVPDDGHRLPAVVVHDGVDRLRQEDGAAHVQRQRRILNGVGHDFDRVPLPQQGEELQRRQGMPLRVEEGLIVHGAAAVVFARVVRVVGGGVAGGPA